MLSDPGPEPYSTRLEKGALFFLPAWTRKGDPLKNLDLIKELLALYRRHPGCKLEWIAAHNGYRWNEYADSLAGAWRRTEV